MSSKRFEWGKLYILNDSKEGVFEHEPAIYVGKKDSDEGCPTICAICGQPLGGRRYDSFCIRDLKGNRMDVMIGPGCIDDRISETEIDADDGDFNDVWEKMVGEFPDSGRWYGTFLHHCIAKPYVRDKGVIEKWEESVLNLPGVKYILHIIDGCRDDGWELEAEKRLDCGNVDLLATHPDRGTIVFDWKSDLCFYNHGAYVEQVVRYMSELSKGGLQKITGYIVWIRDEELEYVQFRDTIESIDYARYDAEAPSPPIRCSLKIEMNGGEGIRSKKMNATSNHHPYGDEVTFFIHCQDLSRPGYDFRCFEASPYREGEPLQVFDYMGMTEMMERMNGILVSFLCSKRRRSFTLNAYWKRVRPFECTLEVHQKEGDYDSYFFVSSLSHVDDDGNDYVEFDVNSINGRLNRRVIDHAILTDGGILAESKTEWTSEELRDGMKLRISDIGECSDFKITIRTKARSTSRPKTPHPRKSDSNSKITSMNPINQDNLYSSPMVDLNELSMMPVSDLNA